MNPTDKSTARGDLFAKQAEATSGGAAPDNRRRGEMDRSLSSFRVDEL
jgi:hypothetical protein